MKTTKLLLMVLFLFYCVPKIHAQQSLITSGANATGTEGTSSYSVGQVVYKNTNSPEGTITEGVQQAFEIYSLGTDKFPKITLQMIVYPNPTTSSVNLKVDETDFQSLQFHLFDIQGREIFKQKIISSETKIKMETLPSAIYYLKIIDENKLLKTFKIIKN